MKLLYHLTLIALLLDHDDAEVSAEEKENSVRSYLRRGLNSIGFVSISLPPPDPTATTTETETTTQVPPDYLLDILQQDPNDVWDISSFNQYIPGNEPNITNAPSPAPSEPYPTCEELMARLSGNYTEPWDLNEMDINGTLANYSSPNYNASNYFSAEDLLNSTDTNTTEEVDFNSTYYIDWTDWCHNRTNNTMYLDMFEVATRQETGAPTTATPSLVPTFSSDAPSLEPSDYPSSVPTTFAPTGSPSSYPTKSPTTKKPTPHPTAPRPTNEPTRRPTKAPTTPKPTPTPKPTNEPSASPTRFPTVSPTAGRGCSMCKDGSFPLAGDKTVLVQPDGVRVTCNDLERAEEASVLRNQFCMDFNGTVNGIHLESYCECRISSDPQLCGTGLCPGTLADETMVYDGLTCREWDDVARAAVDKNVCNKLMMAPGPIDYCCKQEITMLGMGLGKRLPQ